MRVTWVLPLIALVLGCSPKIGNKCTLSTDCSQLGDRLCDTNQPDGYCTVFNCEPDSCPDSICVAFDPTLDPACGHSTDGRWPRYERTFCMAPCGSDSDCRDAYQCVDLTDPNLQAQRAAQVVDTGAQDGGLGSKVCMVRADCSDGVKNNAETDVDCGGGTCQACEEGKKCLGDVDCKSGTCTNGVCAQKACMHDTDCPSGKCMNKVCVSPVPAVCLPPDAGVSDAGAPWTPFDGGP